VILDAATRRNLELTAPMSGSGDGAAYLAGVMDRTATAMGAGCCAAGSAARCATNSRVRQRHDAIEALTAGGGLRAAARGTAAIADLERIISRIALGSARPRDLAALRDAWHGCRRCTPGWPG
jgi:DNA mismatch repair protein MutS